MKTNRTFKSNAFVAKVREFEGSGNSLQEAIKKAVVYCRNHDILKELLEQNASEVLNMLMTEWNWDDAKEVWQEEAREEGMEIKSEEIARNALAEGITIDKIQKITGLAREAIERLAPAP